ncbi:hypothetical protein KP509_03G005200 [Ceratopteris richardii]|uniref:U-box domain-containing protein n=1 Tax=Ceratopteris richardii TaxID=49495 RepID=A0A8T2V4B4_CERRI|nr:hypothetical protein KP509_03G005200 [Ceratopteris richardii]
MSQALQFERSRSGGSSPSCWAIGEGLCDDALLLQAQLRAMKSTGAIREGNGKAEEDRSCQESVRAALLIERLATANRKATVQWIMNVSDWGVVIKGLFRMLGRTRADNMGFRASVKALAALYNGVSDEAELQPLRTIETGDILPLVEQLAGASPPKAERLLIILKAVALVSSCSGKASGAANSQQGGSPNAMSSNDLLLPVLVDGLLKRSHLCNELTVHILWLLCMRQSERLREVAQLGAVQKILLVAQMNCSLPTKQKIVELLRAMKSESCLAPIALSKTFDVLIM